jgi:molybdopterin-dependent oxidoreductase alpha subunit
MSDELVRIRPAGDTEDFLAPGPIPGEKAIASPIPFGIGQDKPHHFREMLEVIVENSDSLGYAWRILNQGVCDGCSLGPRGLRDDVIDGVHLCTTRLKLLRLNTMPSFAPVDVLDMDRLREKTNRELQGLGRLPHPYVYRKGDRGFRRITWAEAMEITAEETKGVPPERMAFFATSRGLTNEAYYTFTKAARLLGSNNVDLCARLCHAATVTGLKGTIGYGAPTCSLSDLIGTDLLLLIGTNLSNNQPVSMKYLAEAKKLGTRIVVVNAVREKGLEAYWVPSLPMSAVFGTRLMDDFVQVSAGGDIAFLNGVLKALIELGAEDKAWIAAHTTGWADTKAKVQSQTWDELEKSSGTTMRQMQWVAELYARARTAVTVYSMGLTQHRHGVQNVEAVANLHLARGMIGRDKCGIMPIRGHSGVQGGGECGVSPTSLPGNRALSEETAREMSAFWGGHAVPTWKGKTTGPMVEACHDGEIDFLYNVGGNLLATMPEPAYVVEAMRRVRFRIHQDIVVNTSALLEPGGTVLLLPAETRYEQRGGGTSTSTERRVRFSPEVTDHPTVGEAKPEYEIPCLVAKAIRPELGDELTYEDSREIRAEMERTMPVYAGIAGLRRAGDSFQWGGPHLCADGTFPNMPGGLARFTPLDPPRIDVPAGAFYLTTRRGKQFNSMVIKDVDHLQGGRDRDDLFMSAPDVTRLGLTEGQRVRVRSETGVWEARIREMAIKPGVLQAYWPECNPLIARRYDPRSEEPDYNAVVWVEPLSL